MKIKVPSTTSILTTKGFEPVTKCIGDAVCIPYADTISAETLSFGHYTLKYETIPVYIEPCNAPRNTINFYPPKSPDPCSLSKDTKLFGIVVPTHEHYSKLFGEAFIVSALDICNIPNLEAIVIKRLQDSGAYTLYKEGHNLFTDAVETILIYLFAFNRIITNTTPLHIEQQDTQLNVIIQTHLKDYWVSDCVSGITLLKQSGWTMEQIKYDRTSRVIIKSLDTTNYSEKERQIFCTLAHRIGLVLYPVDNKLYTSLWGIIPEGLGEAFFNDRTKVKLEKRLSYKKAKKLSDISNFDFKLSHGFWKWLWKSTQFSFHENPYNGAVTMMLDMSENLLPLSYKLTQDKNILLYDRCPFVVFSKHFNLYKEESWVTIDIPEPKILFIRYNNWHILPLAVTT